MEVHGFADFDLVSRFQWHILALVTSRPQEAYTLQSLAW